ncbi:MAG: L,D-transpeptidase family protein [Lachnospiraceae bacterium]|nr:L,D-transpeptidase family protein [Lachnospiraceae bacterium]
MKVKSKELLACALAVCMALSGAAPVGAVSNDEAILEQQNAEESISQGEAIAPPTESDNALEDEKPVVSENVETPAAEDTYQEEMQEPVVVVEDSTSVSENVEDPVEEEQATVSDNEGPAETEEVDDTYWEELNGYWKLKKPGSSEYYQEKDGLVRVRLSGGGYGYYIFDANGNMQTGIHKVSVNVPASGTYYFLDEKDFVSEEGSTPRDSRLGQMVMEAGWQYASAEDRWLYLKDGGMWEASKIGMQKIDQKTYYLDKTGKIQKNVQKKVDGSYYYFGANGAMVANCFQTINNKQYFFEASGKRFEKTDWQKISGNWYYFHKNHYRVLRTKWWEIKENGKKNWYYFDSKTGAMYKNKLFTADGYKYYVDFAGRMVTGLKKVSGKYYYFRPQNAGKTPAGSAIKGWKKIGKNWYYFKSSCQAEARQLAKISGKYYSFTATGKMYKGGLKKINGKYYLFQKQTGKKRNGFACPKGWVKSGKKWYYASAKGYLRTNTWIKYKGSLYYMGKNGVMATNKWMQKDGRWGYINGDGVFSQRWIKSNGKWKYAKDNGKFAKGWTYIVQNGTRYKYFFNNKGYLVQDVRGRVSGPYTLRVDRRRNQITVYARDTDGQYNIPVVAMPCSVGLPATPTPTGTFRGSRAGRWQLLMGPTWGQYATLVSEPNGIFIHSVSGAVANPYSLPANEWNKLGREAASHGCIRVAVIDAKWIYDNCNGATIEVRDYDYAGPFDHKAYRQITAAYNWDPTDPAARGYL